jgi:hypothetical protein
MFSRIETERGEPPQAGGRRSRVLGGRGSGPTPARRRSRDAQPSSGGRRDRSGVAAAKRVKGRGVLWFYNAAEFVILTTRRNKARSPMQWFRSHRLKVASLALFALVCQLMLSFGHVHLDRLAGNRAVPAVTENAVAATAAKVTFAHLPLSPLQNNPSGLGDDFCAICASIGLMGALVVPATPMVLPGISFFKELQWSFAATQARSIDHFHFNARGPPRA